ncbi:MAG: hypothetical protein ACRYG7_23055 [Janthinobacterium lividum]
MKSLVASTLLLLTILASVTISYGQSLDYMAARELATADAAAMRLVEDVSRNVWIERWNNTIHVFVFEDGNLLNKGYPTTATDKDTYIFHLYRVTTSINYRIEAAGTYAPTLFAAPAAAGTNTFARTPRNIQRLDFGKFGPYTTSVTISLKKDTGTNGTYTDVTAPVVVSIANTIHVSVGTGLFYTTLHNPTNIRKEALLNAAAPGDSTLLADQPRGSGFLALTATYYPWGRSSLMLPSRPLFNRYNLGILLGTNVASTTTNFKNFLLGLSYDFALGGSVVAGVNLDTETQKIYGYDNFNFGTDTFSEKKAPKLNRLLYKESTVGFFFGLQVDSRIFTKLFTQR